MESSENPQRLLHDDDRVGDDQFADGKLVKHINNRSIVAPRDLYTDALTENELEQGRKLRKLRSTTLALSQGSFLPLLVDKLRNNIRSRFLLASVYGIATACVALVVVLLLNFNEPVTWTATFSVPPPSTAALGEPLSIFSVRILDHRRRGISGVNCHAILSPVADIPVVVIFDENNVYSRTISCTRGLLTQSTMIGDDGLYCQPHSRNLAQNLNVTTDSDGVAQFVNYTIGFGAPGLYVLNVVFESYNYSLTTFLTMTASMHYFHVDKMPDVDVISVVDQPSDNPNAGINVAFSAQWTSVYSPPTFVCAAVISLDLQGHYQKSPSVLEPLLDFAKKVVEIVPETQTRCTSDIRYLPDLGQYATSMNWTFFVRGTNTLQMYFGVSFLGDVLPISAKQLSSPHMNPSQVIMSFGVNTSDIATVTATGLNDTVEEVQPLGVVVRVIGHNGLPLENKRVYLHVQPSRENTPVVGSAAICSAAVSSKEIIAAGAVTNASGFANFNLAAFSAANATGYYAVFATCDGILADWGNNSYVYETYVTLSVDAARTAATLMWTGTGNDQTPETILQPWQQLPTLAVLNKLGQPVPGKMLHLRPVVGDLSSVISLSLVSKDAGGVALSYAAVLFRVGGSGPIDFQLCIDDLVIANFTRYLVLPPNIVGRQYATPRFVHIPQRMFADMMNKVLVQCVDPSGAGVSNSTVTVTLSDAFAPPPSGTNISSWLTLADSNGFANITLFTPGVFHYTGVYFGVYCNGNNLLALPISVVLKSRIATVFSETVPNSEGMLAVTLLPTPGDEISADYPINVTVKILWFPGYVSDYFDASDFPQFSWVLVTSQSELSFNVSLGMEQRLPGRFGVVFSLSGCIFGPLQFIQLSPTDHTIELVRSAFTAPVVPGQYMTSPPIVRLFARSASGELYPVVGRKAIAQLTIVNDDGSTVYLDYFQNTSAVLAGTFIDIDGDGKICKALSSRSNESGYVVFDQLVPIATSSSVRLTFRYCVYIAMGYLENSSDAESLCVNDTLSWQSDISTDSVVTVSATALSATPGQFVPDFNVTVMQRDGDPVLIVACSVFLADSLTAYLSFPTSPFVPYGTFYGRGPTLTLSNEIHLARRIPSGEYVMYLDCASGRSPNITLVVSSAVMLIQPIIAPPQNFSVFTIIVIHVQLLTESLKPAANMPILLTLTNNDDQTLLYGSQLGELAGGSVTYVNSDSNGICEFSVAVSKASTGNYTISLTQPGTHSLSALQQAAISQIATLESIFACSVDYLPEKIAEYSPDQLNTLTILKNLRTASESNFYDGGEVSSLMASLGLVAESGPAKVSKSFTTVVINPVTSVIIVRDIHARFSLSTLSFANSILGAQAQTFVVNGTDCPIVQFLDVNGQPVPNVGACIDVVEKLDSPNSVTYQIGGQLSNESGHLLVCGIVITANSPMSVPLLITSAGGGGNFTQNIVVDLPLPLTALALMKYIAVALVFLFSPMLFASVPHTKRRYHIAAVASITVQLVLGIVYRDLVPDQAAYRGYYYFVLAGLAAVAILSASVGVLDAVGYYCDCYSLRVFNGERKAEQMLQYVMWIVNITPAKQKLARKTQNDVMTPPAVSPATSAQELMLMERDDSTIHENDLPLPHSVPSELADRAAHLADVLGEKLHQLSAVGHRKPRRRRLYRTARPTLIYDRPELEPIYIPFNFIIVVTMTSVLFVMLAFLVLYVYGVIFDFVNFVQSFLPSAGQIAQAEGANEMIVKGITAAIVLTVRKFPGVGSLTSLVTQIEGFNVVTFLSDVHRGLSEAMFAIGILFLTAGAISFVVVIVTLVLTTRRIPEMIRGIRRGTDKQLTGDVSPIEGYIGLHVIHMLLLQQLVFWLVVLVALLFVIGVIRGVLVDKLQAIVIASAISYLIQYVVQNFLLLRFLAVGKFFVVRPELYALWHFAGLILGVFTGLAKSVVRWVMAAGLVTGLLARLDMSVFPSSFVDMDQAHQGFRGMVVVEAKNGNPIMQVVAALLMTAIELKRCAHDAANAADTTLAIDDIYRDNSCISASIKNLARLLLRHKIGVPADQLTLSAPAPSSGICLEHYIDSRAYNKRTRVQQRLWLWWLLHKNPSLREERKHRLVYEVVDAESMGENTQLSTQ